jgi:hypothetical protein
MVLESDAHAWPEVFFPGIGWVEFEPTASQRPLIRPAVLASSPTETPLPLLPSPAQRFRSRLHLPEDQPPGSGAGLSLAALFRWLALAGSALVLGGALAWAVYIYLQGDSPAAAFQGWARSIPSRLPRISRYGTGAQRTGAEERSHVRAQRPSLGALGYAWTGRLARCAGVALGSHLTPQERASVLEAHFPGLAGPLWAIADAYTADCYSSRPEPDRWSRAEQAELERARSAVAATALCLLPKYLIRLVSARPQADRQGR